MQTTGRIREALKPFKAIQCSHTATSGTLRLVYETNKDLYVLFTRWGEIGETGMFQRTPAANKEEGMKDFCKVFKEAQLDKKRFFYVMFEWI
jgi:hypothetical protein